MTTTKADTITFYCVPCRHWTTDLRAVCGNCGKAVPYGRRRVVAERETRDIGQRDADDRLTLWEALCRLFRRYPRVIHAHDEGEDCRGRCYVWQGHR